MKQIMTVFHRFLTHSKNIAEKSFEEHGFYTKFN